MTQPSHAKCQGPQPRFCCPQHAMLILGARMALGSPDDVPDGPQPSFREGPDPDISPFALGDDSRTRDLFQVADKGQWVVIRGANVLPMTGGGELARHDVLIQDGLIKEIRPVGEAEPAGALFIDGEGRYLIPGLTDIHQHPPLRHVTGIFAGMVGTDANPDDITLPYDLMMFQYLAAGITRIQVMAGSPEDLANREAIREGRYRGPHMRIASPVIDSPAAIWSSAITWYANDEQGGRTAAHKLIEHGYDLAKPYTMLGRDAYFGLVSECKRLGIEVMGHVPAAVTPDEAFEAGQTGVAHCFEYFYHGSGDRRFDPDVIAQRVRLSKDLGVTLQTTLGIARVYEYDSGLIPATDMNFADTLDPLIRRVMREDSDFIQSWRSNPVLMAGAENIFDYSTQICQALHAEGVRLLPGTDMSASAITGENSLHHELQLLVDRKVMSSSDALKAATSASAEYQGDSVFAGTIEPGKRSDLVLLDGNPAQNIANTARIDTVIQGNAILRREARQRGLARLEARYAAMLVSDKA